jgi:hypothetical protein
MDAEQAKGTETVEAPATQKTLTIKAPNYQVAEFELVGTAPYVQHAFSSSQRKTMRAKQEEGTAQAGKRRDKPPKNFERLYREAQYRERKEGWFGQPVTGYRNAMIEACRMVGFAMTRAKCSLFVVADGWAEEGAPLVKLEGTPERTEIVVRNETGVADIRVRPMWREWRVRLRVRFNADQFTELDVANLLLHAGISIGIGEGRPFSPNSAGLGWGTWTLASLAAEAAA